MKQLIYKYPVLSSVVIVFLFLILSRLAGEAWLFGNGAFSLIAYEVLHIIIPLLFVLIFGDKRVYTKGSIRNTLTANRLRNAAACGT